MNYQLVESILVVAIVVVAAIGMLSQRWYYLNHPIVEIREVEREVLVPSDWRTNRYKPVNASHYDVHYMDLSPEGYFGDVWRKFDVFPDIGASELSVVRYAKKRLGLTGIRCKREANGQTIELRPNDGKSILFITHCDNPFCESQVYDSRVNSKLF